ncbi:hypothetical protein H257_14736 [Aphanomyces astaci]|uniref:Uncharacterized protein n=1 Tax=Aphanomyces astaci TaxID=112090 RepID=W4FSK7_APHAT|nr:hypothetical protein H257_14736 [Aphanomyces astaci]ETV69598.1 hypothetical protein H257_14736 [Aphanomyces astaci]|eukprot:XP_009840925.1 hypothetical protein H257_14736 [Aphanomyces astaci]
MEHTIVSAKGKAKNKSTKENAKLKAPPQIIATVQELRNTTADGEQSLPDAGSEAQRELLQRIKLAYPSDSEDETKDDLDRLALELESGTTSAKRPKTQWVSNSTYRGEDKETVLNRQRYRRDQLRIAKAKSAAAAAKKKEYRQTKRAKKSQMRQADEQPQVKDFLMEVCVR